MSLSLLFLLLLFFFLLLHHLLVSKQPLQGYRLII
jgi:hypothetical protein